MRDTAESLEEGSDEKLVGDIFDLSKTERLTEQLTITIDSVFYAPDAAELVGIMQDWATHTDEDQVCQTLCVLLRECERDRDPGHLRRVLSDFFLALPDPWKTKASSILAAQTLDFGGKHADRRASQQASCSTFRCSERGTSNDLPFVF